MKIAIILPKLVNQGPIIVAKDIVDNIKRHIELVDVYYFDDVVVEVDFDCNVYKINLFDKIDFNKYDVIHSHMLRPDFYVWLHRSKKDSPLFLSTLHQNIYDNLKGNYNSVIAILFEKIWLYFLRKQDFIVVLTDVMKNFYIEKSQLKIRTIYNGRNLLGNSNQLINKEDLDKIIQLKLNYKIVGSHCLLTKRKGIHQIIESLPFLEDFAFVILGDGQEINRLKKLAKNLGVLERCYFVGYRINAVDYLKYFDVYIMSSYSEGFPLGLLEAGLSQLPIVCSDIPIFRELFTSSEVCFFEPNNIKGLVDSINYCFNNKEQFSYSIYHLIKQKYSVSKMADDYLVAYHNNNAS